MKPLSPAPRRHPSVDRNMEELKRMILGLGRPLTIEEIKLSLGLGDLSAAGYAKAIGSELKRDVT